MAPLTVERIATIFDTVLGREAVSIEGELSAGEGFWQRRVIRERWEGRWHCYRGVGARTWQRGKENVPTGRVGEAWTCAPAGYEGGEASDIEAHGSQGRGTVHASPQSWRPRVREGLTCRRANLQTGEDRRRREHIDQGRTRRKAAQHDWFHPSLNYYAQWLGC